MLKDFFIHMCIVITFLFVAGALFKNHTNQDSMRRKLIHGVLSGLLGSALMLFSIQITPTIIMDLRHIAILISAFYGGFTASIISAIIICTSRILFFDGSIETSIVTTTMMVSIAIVAPVIKKKIGKTDITKWSAMGLYGLLTITIGFLYLLGFTSRTYQLLFNYWIITTIAGLIIFFLAQYINQSNQLFNQMKLESKIDYLTGLNNVRQFDRTLNDYIKKAQVKNQKVSLIMLDIDHFKKVNDTYGHPAGDEVLRQLGAIIMSCSCSNNLVSRNGGEEFSVLLQDCPYEKAIQIAEHIRQAVEKHTFILPNRKEIKVTVSLGVSTYLETTDDSEEFINQADEVLYQAKRTGRNKVN
jgi:diguanylate cyclase